MSNFRLCKMCVVCLSCYVCVVSSAFAVELATPINSATGVELTDRTNEPVLNIYPVLTESSSPEIRGSSTLKSQIQVYINNDLIVPYQDESGLWVIPAGDIDPLQPGEYEVLAEQASSASKLSARSIIRILDSNDAADASSMDRYALCRPHFTGEIDASSGRRDIIKLQWWLRDNGYPRVSTSGKYGPLTAEAVRDLKKRYFLRGSDSANDRFGLLLADIINKQICAKKKVPSVAVGKTTGYINLGNLGKLKCPPFRFALKEGSQGDSVVRLQKFLRTEMGDDYITVTGDFDSATTQAIRRFQEKYRGELITETGAARPSGNFDIHTIRKANEILGCGV